MIPKRLLIDFDSLKAEDKVWVVREVSIKSIEHTLKVIEDSDGNTYNKEGKFYGDDKVPSLYKSNPFDLISEYPKEMWVKDRGDKHWADEKVVIVWFDPRRDRYLDNDGVFWDLTTDTEPELAIEITRDEAIEELKKSEKYKNKNLTIK